MKLSMWMLADWLNAYDPVVKIEDGQMVLRSVRMLTSDCSTNQSCMCLGYASDFFDSEDSDLICVQGHDMLLLSTNDIDQVFNDILAAFDYYNDWEEKLQELVSRNGSLQEILDLSVPVLDAALSVADSSYRNCSYSFGTYDNDSAQYVRMHKRIPEEIVEAVYRTANQEQKNNKAYILTIDYLNEETGCKNLFLNQYHIGWVTLLSYNKKVKKQQLQLLDVLGEKMEQWLLYDENSREFTGNLVFFQQLLENNSCDLPALNRYMQGIGWNNSQTKVLYLVKYINEDIPPAAIRGILEEWSMFSISFIYHNYVVVIVNESLEEYNQFADHWTSVLRRFHCYSGKSYSFTNMENMWIYYQQAVIAMQYGSHTIAAVNDCREYAVEGILETLRTHAPLQILHPALAELSNYDYEHHTELLHTLNIYLRNERNQIDSAQELHIHRNSLLYRVRKIQELTDINLEDKEERLYLVLSLLITQEQHL